MKNKKHLYFSVSTMAAFILWTAAILLIDVMPVGPKNSAVGFSSINSWFHSITGVHMILYTITDWLGLVPIAFAFGFALLGLYQWIVRKKLFKVDHSILILGGFYIAVMAVYILFENITVNYRPVLINGQLETSYPSSTTMLVMCVMPTATAQLKSRIKNRILKKCTASAISVFTAFMVVCRIISGVHWLTDIIGGTLISISLVEMYFYLTVYGNFTQKTGL